MRFDIVVVGAGTAGLCFARSLAGSGLRVAVVEQQQEAALATPADDGREIAITHRSRQLLRALGMWSLLRAEEIAPLCNARVLDGEAHAGLTFGHAEAGTEQLGWLVPNQALRRIAWAQVAGLDDVQCLTGVRVRSVQTADDGAQVTLDNGEQLQAPLLVAADGRFSQTRRALGMTAHSHDFGKSMLVLRMRHAAPHAATAWEWFGVGQTLALLPLHDRHVSSVVVTLPPQEMHSLLAGDDAALGAAISTRFRQRLGAMEVIGPRCVYPLVAVYAPRFVTRRGALIGDAAVGMHPLTAHGFNFGLRGQATLARELLAAVARGQPLGDMRALRRYERAHRLATRSLYLATGVLAGLYTDDRAPARVLRKLALATAARLPPFRRAVMAGLIARDRALERIGG